MNEENSSLKRKLKEKNGFNQKRLFSNINNEDITTELFSWNLPDLNPI